MPSPEESREIIGSEVKFWRTVLGSLETGDGNYAYADTLDSIEMVDQMLEGNEAYAALRAQRPEISKKLMEGATPEEKAEGLEEFKRWLDEVEKVI